MNDTRTISYHYDTAQTFIRILTALVVVGMCLYVAMIFTIVHRVAFRAHAQDTIVAQTLHISDLESQYIAQKNTLAVADYASKGFTVVLAKSYINSHTTGLSLRTTR